MQENSRYLAALRKLLDRPENRVCADCKEAGAGARPSWASINTGQRVSVSGVVLAIRSAGEGGVALTRVVWAQHRSVGEGGVSLTRGGVLPVPSPLSVISACSMHGVRLHLPWPTCLPRCLYPGLPPAAVPICMRCTGYAPAYVSAAPPPSSCRRVHLHAVRGHPPRPGCPRQQGALLHSGHMAARAGGLHGAHGQHGGQRILGGQAGPGGQAQLFQPGRWVGSGVFAVKGTKQVGLGGGGRVPGWEDCM